MPILFGPAQRYKNYRLHTTDELKINVGGGNETWSFYLFIYRDK